MGRTLARLTTLVNDLQQNAREHAYVLWGYGYVGTFVRKNDVERTIGECPDRC